MIKYRSKKEKTSFYLFILVILSSISFYNPFQIFSKEISKLFFYVAVTISLIYACRNGININKSKYPSSSFKLIIYGILFSSLMPLLFHNQSVTQTLVSSLPYIFSYVFFYILMKLNIPKDKILKAIWTFCFIGMFIYLINLILFPKIIFGDIKENFDLTRGIVRLSIPSFFFILLLYFYSINNYVLYKKKKDLLLILLTLIFIFLSVTRQVILLSILIGIFMFIKNVSLVKKIVIALLIVIVYQFLLPKIPIYNEMVELSKNQIEKNQYEEEDIRITAWKFYIHDYQTNTITAIFGNGIPSIGKSNWGNKFEKTVSRDYGGNGCLYVDVGWAGFYWLFGLLSTLGLAQLLIKAILKKKAENEQYLSCWCLLIFLISFTSAPILFNQQIICITTILYLIYGKNKINSYNNIKLQQLQ